MSELAKIFQSQNAGDLFWGIRDRIFQTKHWELDAERLVCASLSEGELFVVLSAMLIEEVANGGFSQYLANSSGDYAEVTREALRRVGATEAAEALDEIHKTIYGGAPIPTDRAKRSEILFAWEDSDQERANGLFARHDSAFYRGEAVENVTASYIRAHEEMFT